MKISDSARLIIVKSNDSRKSILRKLYTRKSILPLSLGIIIGISLATLFIIPSLSWYQIDERYKRDYHYHNLMTTTKIQKHELMDNTILADKLYSEVRVLCWIMTNSTNHESRAQWVKKTWGQRCNKLIFMSDEVDDELGSVDLNVGYGRDVLWAKTKEAFKYVYKNNFNDADWFLKADDDTYVILENLRYLLYSYKTEDPIYFGCKLKRFVNQGYMSGGAGYVLSKEALTRFVETGLTDDNKCSLNSTGPEDVEIGICLENVGVIAGDSRDSSGRRRFFPFGPNDHYVNLEPLDDFWYSDYSFYNISEGLNCCSDYPISFHYVQPTQMHFIEYAIYHIRAFGIFYNSDELPDKLSTGLLKDDKTTIKDTSTINIST